MICSNRARRITQSEGFLRPDHDLFDRWPCDHVQLTGAYLEKSELLNLLPIDPIVEGLVTQGLGRKRPSLDARTCGILHSLLLSTSLPLGKLVASALSRGLLQNSRVVGLVFKVLTDVMETDRGRGLQLMQNTDELRANIMTALGSSKPEIKQMVSLPGLLDDVSNFAAHLVI